MILNLGQLYFGQLYFVAIVLVFTAMILFTMVFCHVSNKEDFSFAEEQDQLDIMIDAIDNTSRYVLKAFAENDKQTAAVSVKDVKHVPLLDTANKSTIDSINELVVAYPQIYKNYLYTL